MQPEPGAARHTAMLHSLNRSSRSAGLVAALLLASSCASDDSRALDPSQRAGADELSVHHGKVCPRRLPQSDDDHGLGTSEPAASAPSMPPMDAAWVCEYHAYDAGPGPNGDGTTLSWKREGEPHQVDAARLPDLEDALSTLSPAPAQQACTADLGPRWLLVYTSDRDLTGVVVDAYGCRSVRLTDDPFLTPPGQASQPGLVSGTLEGPADLRDLISITP